MTNDIEKRVQQLREIDTLWISNTGQMSGIDYLKVRLLGSEGPLMKAAHAYIDEKGIEIDSVIKKEYERIKNSDLSSKEKDKQFLSFSMTVTEVNIVDISAISKAQNPDWSIDKNGEWKINFREIKGEEKITQQELDKIVQEARAQGIKMSINNVKGANDSIEFFAEGGTKVASYSVEFLNDQIAIKNSYKK